MNYGYAIGASGIIAAMHRQDVAANNLANIQTAGFKPDTAFTIPRQAAREEDGLMNLPSNAMLERLGAGVLLRPDRTDFSQGTLAKSRNPFDLAIDGKGFLTVASGGANGAAGETRLTRDGRLTLDSSGKLVTVATGQTVLDSSGKPITLNPGRDFAVDSNGTITQGGAAVATLGFVDVANKSLLKKVGDNQFGFVSKANAGAKVAATGRVMQYATEDSGADAIKAMMAVQSAADLVGTTAKVMQMHDDLMSRAINTLGRVTG
jgi:flagellar basal body rod protein FlgG